MEITRGIVRKAQKVIIYGPEGIGKTTFASQFPKPVFIDTEGGSAGMDVARLPKPTSWAILLDEISYIKGHPELCGTINIDTIDWAEQLCIESVCAKYKKTGIEDFGYGNGYVYVKEELGRLLNSLQEIIDIGINVVLTAHAQIRKFEQPDEMGSYDRWELKLGKKTGSQTAPLVKEWADMVLFANYETIVITTETKKNKAQGGKRVMYTEHHSCWDAKNRCGLPSKLPFDYKEIAHIITPDTQVQTRLHESKPVEVTAPEFTVVSPEEAAEFDAAFKGQEPATTQSAQNTAQILPQMQDNAKTVSIKPVSENHQKLADLLGINGVSVDEIRTVVAKKGYYPQDTPVEKYDPAFVGGVLVSAWQQVYKMILDNRSVPF